MNVLFESMGVYSSTVNLASLFPRVILVMAILYGGYRLLPNDYRVLALPIYVSTLSFAAINNTMLAVLLYQRLVWDSGFHIMMAIFTLVTDQ